MWKSIVSNEPVPIPVDGVLDLHTFRPNETADVVEEYLLVCLEKKISQVRIIHGKGKGVQRKIVHYLQSWPHWKPAMQMKKVNSVFLMKPVFLLQKKIK